MRRIVLALAVTSLTMLSLNSTNDAQAVEQAPVQPVSYSVSGAGGSLG